MSFPQPELRYDAHHGAAPGMTMAGPGMPTAVPYDHQTTYPIAYPQPSQGLYSPPAPPPCSPTYPPSHATNNGFLSPFPQNASSTYPAGGYYPSRPSTPYSQMTTTVVGSEHSHDVGFTPQPRAQSAATQATTSGTKPPTGPPTGTSTKTKDRGQPGDSHASGCCIIM